MWKEILLAAAVLTNAAAFLMFGVDKRKARRKEWRVKENALLGLCACLGALGGLIGMKVFRHKTQKDKFRWLVPLMLSAQIGLFIWIYMS